MTTPLPWSHSALQAFITCPRQFEELRILRNYQDEKNDAALWGDEFHTAAEHYIAAQVAELQGTAADGGDLPANMQTYKPYLDTFVQRPGTTLVEQQLGLNQQLAPCDFFAPDIWCRGIIDVLTLQGPVALVDDHKTGKRKKDMQQLIIFALLTFYHYPQITTAVTTYHWVAEGTRDTETFQRSQMSEMWAELLPKLDRYRRAFHMGVFPANPSGLCKRHCPVDTCEYYARGLRR